MRKRVKAGVPVGIWVISATSRSPCSIAPFDYRPLGGLEGQEAERRLMLPASSSSARYAGGVSAAALSRPRLPARVEGARVVEAYPVDPDRRATGSWDSSGLRESRLREVGRAGSRRHVMRLEV
jgi:hypothetical protein